MRPEPGPPAKKTQRYFSALYPRVRAPAEQKHPKGFVRNLIFAINKNKKKIKVISVGRKLDPCRTLY